ncbi:superfamily II RNA helicase [Rubidibacter lacunae KORDI 51-2]|uniref:Superfamily II RNA helicase n=1 Tax=Rubidibacter lacunae KORDI 51-2 TaxID=582515 RepID=U5DRJ9_9CHRO|nr:DEAD/DEAH box helicase [Rubidibacter lacunae]ERN42320.1 superfamily II RNA helicase [Rubidibacter lacunae KORDI 51-2]
MVNDLPPAPALNVEQLFPFQLDPFQLQAISAIDAGKSAVVSVPTGSGKTLVGEYAIHRALARGKRVFYTTPLKALSNQKWRDFQAAFGAEQVGLLTGDTSIERDAAIVVMTTEVFRNMLYGTRIGQVGVSLEGVEALVLDECHYMNDPSRGTVWEESIVYCPPAIQLIALSATIANADQLTDWIARVHGPTELIESDFRPVPLQFHFCNLKGLFPLLDPEGQKINPRLREKKPPRRGDKRRRERRDDCPGIAEVVERLQSRDMLPAIYFIFSRRGCDEAVRQLGSTSLVTIEEAQILQQRLENFLREHPEGARAGQAEPLTRGIAAHHAGILPAWKGLVEELFSAGLVKVVFATETLAAGINMPARTTAISSMSKRTDRGHRMLRASEFLQMSGRAGRRGMDPTGHVVCVQTRFEGAKEAAFLATKTSDPLVSQFTPTYGMVLNLLQTHTMAEAKDLLERSFAQYLATLKLAPEQQAIAGRSQELARLDIELAPIQTEHIFHFEKLHARLREEKRIAKYLHQQARETRAPAIQLALEHIAPGDIVYLKGPHIALTDAVAAAVCDRLPASPADNLLCLGADNYWYVAARDDITGIADTTIAPSEVEGLRSPDDFVLAPGRHAAGDDRSAPAAAAIAARATDPPIAPEVAAQQDKIGSLQAQLDVHPLHQWGKPGRLIKHYYRRIALREELAERNAKTREHRSQHWQEFLNICDVLRDFEALDGDTPTALGRMAAAIRADNELWLALALGSDACAALDGHQLAATVCALVSEPPRPDSNTNFEPSPFTLDALDALRRPRRLLFQVQHRNKVAIPIWLEYGSIGIIEAWVRGIDWVDLCDGTTLDEGDIVRMLRRTMDILSQIPHVPHLSESTCRTASDALAAMKRFPVED